MIKHAMTPALSDLLGYLDGLRARPSLEELTERLRASELTADDVEQWTIFCDEGYQRNLIKTGPMYQAFALCWKSRQRSSIHDHANSICGVKVLTGVGTETIFERKDCGLVCPTTSREMRAGDICVSEDADIHQISNYVPEQPLVTLHLYLPPLTWVNTYSLESPEVRRLECPVCEAP